MPAPGTSRGVFGDQSKGAWLMLLISLSLVQIWSGSVQIRSEVGVGEAVTL